MALKVKDIAEKLQISTATVSLVLNNKPGASEETRQRVLKFVEEMGYDTNALSKPALKNNKCIRFVIYKKHGNVVSDTPFFQALTEGIDLEARKDGYNMIVSHINENENRAEMLRVIEENPLEGMIILATEMNAEDLQPFKQMKIPMVILDNYFKMEKLDTVVIGNMQGAYEASKHLIDMGHKDIGYLHSSVWINNFDERKDGYTKALSEHGIPQNKKSVFRIDPTIEGAFQDMTEILKANPSLPTAFFADNDIIAIGAIKALKEAGKRVPEDISIVGFDDMPFCEIVDPAITSIRVYKQRMGMLAVRRLLEKIDGKSLEFVKLEVGTELIERKSVVKM